MKNTLTHKHSFTFHQVAEMPLFFAGLQPTIRTRLQQVLILFTLFFLFILLKCHETSFLQRVALRRIASLASCTHDSFRVLKKVDEAIKPRR